MLHNGHFPPVLAALVPTIEALPGENFVSLHLQGHLFRTLL